MNEKLHQAVKDGQELATKKSWLAKGYVDLLDAINVELKNIPDMDEDCIEYVIKEWSAEDNGGNEIKKTVTLDLIFRGDAYLQLSLNTRCPYEGTWSGKSLDKPATATIRLFAEKLADAFDFFAGKIAERNLANQTAIDTMTGLITKLQK
ncbi:MAG: hypothetical protein WC347_02450 [Smithellaceae bacterium]